MAKFEREGYEYKGFKLGETVVYGGEEVKIVGFDMVDTVMEVALHWDSPAIKSLQEYKSNTNMWDRMLVLDNMEIDTPILWVSIDGISKVYEECECKEDINYYPNKDAECKIEYREVFGRYVVKYNDGTVNNIELMSDREFETFKTQIDEMNKPKKWRADEGGIYYYISTIGDIKVGVDKRKEMSQFSQSHYDIGNYFKTEELAQEKLEEFKNIFK